MLVVSNAKMKADLAGLESKILELLSNSSGNILEDEALINMLAQAKVGGAPEEGAERAAWAVTACAGPHQPAVAQAAAVTAVSMYSVTEYS
jgi:hypothetical protein